MKCISNFKLNEIEISHVLLDISIKNELKEYFTLFEKCFGRRPNITEDLFNWFNFGDLKSENYNFGFLVNGRLVACYGLLPMDVKISGKIIKAALCTNVMTDPDFGGKGLFAKIGELSISYIKNKGISLCIGVPNENAIKGHLKIGWQKVSNIDFFEINKTSITNINKNSHDIIPINEFNFRDYEFDAFYNDKFDFHFLRNSSWLNWRTSKPNSSYEKLCLIRENIFKGYIIIKKYKDETTKTIKLHIVDYLYDSDSSFEALLNHVLCFSLKNNFDLINLWNYESDIVKTMILTKLGFKKTNSSNYVILYPLQKNILLENIKKPHLTLFDNDVY